MSIFKNAVRSGLAICGIAAGNPACASDKSSDTVTTVAQVQDFNQGLGSLRTIEIQISHAQGPNTFVLTPIIGERRIDTFHDSAIGASLEVYHVWSPKISSRSQVFVSENKAPFAHWTVSQDLTVKVAGKTTVTVGGRFARYFGDNDVVYLSGGFRQYFKLGSISYRLTWTKPAFSSGYLAHLGSITIKDNRGAGKTELWVSYGSASLIDNQSQDSFRGKDYGFVVQRNQPLGGNLSAIVRIGVSSYDRPGARATARTFGIGLSSPF